jgi:hypothetical protein
MRDVCCVAMTLQHSPVPTPVHVLSAEHLNSTLKAPRGVSPVPFSLLTSDAISFDVSRECSS